MKIAALILSLLLVGCATTKPVYIEKVVEVKVPVIEKVTIEDIQCPPLPIRKITKDTPSKTVVEYYVQTVKVQNECIRSYRELVKAVNSGGQGE